ncbi:hypothetical protein JXB41_07435 [Candidatus Woesearchaeota archaeon]|nr:hypothetical protein [Candidatus Woesearchaeota archaeon]
MNDYYSPQSKELKEIDRMEREFAVDDFGASTNPFQHQTEALKARIFHGANKVEFSFFGYGKSHEKQFTPESFGKRERQDMRELAEFNKVETSTHASVGINGLSGLSQNRFDEHHRKESIDEVKKAVHFAAQATTGGAVVFHAAEAPRPLFSEYARYKKEGEARFQLYPTEEEEEIILLVDPIEKEIMRGVKENAPIALPVQKIDPKTGEPMYLKDENGEYVKDEIFEPYDKIHKGKIPIYDYDEKTGDIKTRVITFTKFREEEEKKIKHKYNRDPTKEEREETIKKFFQFQQTLQLQYHYGFGKQAEREYMEGLEHRKKIIDSLNFYKKLKERIPESEWWKLKRQGDLKARGIGRVYIPPEVEDPVEYLEDSLNEVDRSLMYGRELALSGRRQTQEALKKIDRATPIQNYAKKKAAESMGEIGEYVWQMNVQHKKDLKNPLFLAPENLFPETYGSHPDELRELVENGREAMVKRLEKYYGKSKQEAKKLAENHIKATIDIGHMNTWRKYFIAKPGESIQERDKRFNQWLLDKTKKLVDEGIVGHIHVNDNFGFNDEHLSAGDGNAPIKEFIEQAKKAGLKNFIVESGSINPMRALPDTWAHFGSPVYHIHVPGVTRDTWTDFWHSYFGRTEKPRYIVGSYSPSQDFRGAPFYSGLDLEGLEYFEK